MSRPNTTQHEAQVIFLSPHHNSQNLTPRTVKRPPQPIRPRVINATGTPVPTRATMPQPLKRTTGERIVIGLKILGALLATAAAAGVVWLAYLAVMAVIAFVTTVVTWISAHLFLIGAVIIGLLFFGGSGAACAGIHCGGCKG